MDVASQLGSELSSGNMRIIAGMSHDQHLVYMLKTAESILAVAAHELIHQGQVCSWLEILRAFKRSQINSSTIPGCAGEVAVQVLFIMAWQVVVILQQVLISKKPSFMSGFIPAIPIFDYLCTLLGKNFKEHALVAEVEKALEGGFMHVNEFVKTFKPAEQTSLLDISVCGAGLACMEMQRGSDGILGIV